MQKLHFLIWHYCHRWLTKFTVFVIINVAAKPACIPIFKFANIHGQSIKYTADISTSVTLQRWRSHHLIRHSGKPHAACKPVILKVWHCINRDLQPFCSCDLDLDPVTLCDLDQYYLDMVYQMCCLCWQHVPLIHSWFAVSNLNLLTLSNKIAWLITRKCTDLVGLGWAWPSPNDLDTRPWPRYYEDVPVYQKSSF